MMVAVFVDGSSGGGNITYLLIGGNILYLSIDDGGNRAALWENGRPGGGRDRGARGRRDGTAKSREAAAGGSGRFTHGASSLPA